MAATDQIYTYPKNVISADINLQSNFIFADDVTFKHLHRLGDLCFLNCFLQAKNLPKIWAGPDTDPLSLIGTVPKEFYPLYDVNMLNTGNQQYAGRAVLNRDGIFSMQSLNEDLSPDQYLSFSACYIAANKI